MEEASLLGGTRDALLRWHQGILHPADEYRYFNRQEVLLILLGADKMASLSEFSVYETGKECPTDESIADLLLAIDLGL